MSDEDKPLTDEQRRKAVEVLSEHKRMTAQPGQGDAPAPFQAGATLDGNYTVLESRDRAAHIPGLHEREDGPVRFNDRELAARKDTESYLKAESAKAGLSESEWQRGEQHRDMGQFEAQTEKGESKSMVDKKSKPPVASVSFGDVTGNVWENERKDGKSFYNVTFERAYKDAEGRERTSNSFGVSQLGDLRKAADVTEAQMNKLYEEKEKSNAKGGDNVTPEEKSRVDQSLNNANIARDKIGPASEVSGKPTPNDPSSMDKSREVGQDLNKSGVTMDKE